MNGFEARDAIIAAVNGNSNVLNASAIDETGEKPTIGVENEATGDLFFLEVIPA